MALYIDLHSSYLVDSNKILVEDIDAINESINNILSVEKGTWLAYRDFGSTVNQYLFEPMNEATANLLKIAIFQAIDQFEPRVEVDFYRSEVVPDLINQVYRVKMIYWILAFGRVGQFDKTFKAKL